MYQLLGLPSDDIDIALDDQSGAEFARAVNEFLTAKGMETHGIAVIQVCFNFQLHMQYI